MEPFLTVMAYRFDQGESRLNLVNLTPPLFRPSVAAMLYRIECERLICHERFLP